MGLFNRLGREVEQFKQAAKESAAETHDYRCEACDARFSVEADECPECEADAVVEVDDESG